MNDYDNITTNINFIPNLESSKDNVLIIFGVMDINLLLKII